MKRFFVFGLVTIGLVTLVSFRMTQNQVPYQSTTLSPYSSDLGIIIQLFANQANENIETYAKIETGLEEYKIYAGTGKQGKTPLYWIQIDVGGIGNTFMLMDMSKKTDESLNICKDTIKHILGPDKNTMVAFEMIHHLSTNEIQYIWLDENNNKSEKAIIIPLDKSLGVENR